MQTRVWPVVRALWRAVRRDLGTFASLRANNFFLFVALLMWGALESGTVPVSSFPFLALLGFLMLLPLAADPLSKIPRARLASWPLGWKQRAVLRASALLVSPMLWIAAGLIAAASKSALALVAVPFATHHIVPPRWHPLRYVPAGPGRLAQAIRANFRQMLTVLDTYLAVAIGVLAHLPLVPADARPILAMLVAIALSTYAQCLFTLDGSPTRYRLLPVPGWQIVLAKDTAYLALLLALTAGVAAGPALCFALMSLTIGRYPSMTSRLPVDRWRFAGGRVLFGVMQLVFGVWAGQAETAFGPVVILALIAPYAVSVWRGGRSLLRDSVV